MRKALAVPALMLFAAASPAAALVSVQSTGGGMVTYDDAALMLTGSFAADGGGSIATLTLDFAAPLVRTTTLYEIRFTGSGYRYVRSFITGTVTGVHLSVDAPGGGINYLKFDTTAGFSAPFEHFTSLDYYFYPDGTIRTGVIHFNDYYQHFFSTALFLVDPACARSGSTVDGYRTHTSAYTLSSEVPGYTPCKFGRSNHLDTYLFDASSDLDLYAVRAGSTVVEPDFAGNISYSFAASVPEPGSWALLIAGFGLTGAVLRRRRISVPAA